MHSHRQGIEEALTTTKGQLEKLHTDIGRTLEKISSREKYLNNQLEAPLGDFKRLSDNLAAAREQYKSVSGGKYITLRIPNVSKTHHEFLLRNGVGKTCLWKKIYFAQ